MSKWFLLLAPALLFAQSPAKGKAAGSASAPITIEVFSDFQCPSCKVLHEEALEPLMRDYVAAGKVYLVRHEFPLPAHAYARDAAAWATAAARIGRYEQVAKALFASQAAWTASGKLDEVVARALTPAEAQAVRKLVKDPGIGIEIQRDVAAGTAAGIHQTPTMFIRRGSTQYPLAGAVRYELLRRFLDDQLAK
jgi:protein-disulfide isomerase